MFLLLTLRLDHSSGIQGIFEHRFLNEKELRNQMLWLGRIGKINCSKKNEMGERSKYFLQKLCFYGEVQTSTK